MFRKNDREKQSGFVPYGQMRRERANSSKEDDDSHSDGETSTIEEIIYKNEEREKVEQTLPQQQVYKPTESPKEDNIDYNQMPFMGQIDEERRSTVLKLLKGPYPIETKLKHIANDLPGKYLIDCKKWLENERCDFMRYVHEDNRGMLALMLEKNDISSLKSSIIYENKEAQTAFGFYMEHIQGNGSQLPSISASFSQTKASSLAVSGLQVPPFRQAALNRSSEQKQKLSSSRLLSHSQTTSPLSSQSTASCLPDKKNSNNFSCSAAPKPQKGYLPGFWERPEASKLNCPKVMNILLLGETGVGKSTFLNGLVNHLSFKDLEEASSREFHILVDASFTHTNPAEENGKLNKMNIFLPATLPPERGAEEVKNEINKTGQSCTQFPRSYLFEWGPSFDRKYIRFIDTPGVADTRGINTDKENFKNIMNFIQHYDQIQAILILSKPNESRLTTGFTFALSELLSRLNVSAAKNILFCFTRARESFYRSGETFAVIEEHLKEQIRPRGIDLHLHEYEIRKILQKQFSDNTFNFDNESIRFLCAWKKLAKFTSDEVDHHNDSWMNAVDETLRLFATVARLKPHQVHETLEVNNMRQTLSTLIRPLAELMSNNLQNNEAIKNAQEEIKLLQKDGKTLQKDLECEQTVLTSEPLEYPITVCTSSGCNEFKKIKNSTRLEMVPKQLCHSHCYLPDTMIEHFPNDQLKKCCAFKKFTGICEICTCSWDKHMHVKYKIVPKTETVFDEEVQKRLNDIKNKEHKIEAALKVLREKQKALTQENEICMQCCLDISAYLQRHSIVPINDSYGRYIDQLIENETHKINHGASKKLLNQLHNHKADYEEQKKLMEKSIKKEGHNVKSGTQIRELINDLKKASKSAQIIVENIEWLEKKENSNVKRNIVSLNTGWLGDIFNH